MSYRQTDSLWAARSIAQGFYATQDKRMAQILEFIVFGSTAKCTSEQVNDLDVLIVFSYGDGRNLLADLLPVRLDELRIEHGIHMPVDLTPVHVGYFWHQLTKRYYEAKFMHGFFDNVLGSSFLRWDQKSGSFERRDREYLARKYAVPSSRIEHETIDRVVSSWIDLQVLENY